MTFDQWLLSEEGKRCETWPVTDIKFLRNRLWWAFQAGVVEGMTDRHPTDTSAGDANG